MHKIRGITILAILAIICLQGLWVHRMYQSYLAELHLTVEKCFNAAIEKEISGRGRTSGKPFITIKSKEFMTPKEIASYKGDTVILGTSKERGVGKSFLEVLMQVEQDIKMAAHTPLNLPVLDSLFIAELGHSYPHLILSYGAEGQIRETTGTLLSR